jgi:hypothetical protein
MAMKMGNVPLAGSHMAKWIGIIELLRPLKLSVVFCDI